MSAPTTLELNWRPFEGRVRIVGALHAGDPDKAVRRVWEEENLQAALERALRESLPEIERLGGKTG
jgi:hypothetical protein